jgi:YVTN family beta-propeller protein
VYRFSPNAPPESRCVLEKRLALPEGAKNRGFVEALLDTKRRELWVSNMEDSAVHIFDLDSLAYKQSVKTGGRWTKVIAQSADGSLAACSNWLSMDVSVFDSGTKALLAVVPVGGTPRGLAFSPDGKLLYAAIYDRAEIAVIDLAKMRKTASWTFYPGGGAARHIVYKSGAEVDVL